MDAETDPAAVLAAVPAAAAAAGGRRRVDDDSMLERAKYMPLRLSLEVRPVPHM